MNHDGVNHTSYASQSPPNGNSVISHLSILRHALITTIADLIPLKSPPNPIQPIKLSPKFSQSFHKFASIMAQRTENEETQFKLIPETLCGGVVGAPATNNSLKSPSFSDGSVVLDEELKNTKRVEAVKVVVKREVNRCSGCRKRVGLTGFRCRCGELFCSEHRYSDRHDCSYDYKRAGREAIAKENPVVKAAKIVRI